ncbi:MAG: class I SAM-dependent methyltransferase [Thaumarchaeota archaeon]|nr:class I SAM-dependent methyltransferase [Nitrososphaerota archaeon]
MRLVSKARIAWERISVFISRKLLKRPLVGDYNIETRQFYDEYAAKYPEAEINYAFDAMKTRKNFVEQYLTGATQLILDIGCGIGVYNADVGVDISHVVLKKRGGNTAVAHTSFLPFRNGSFNTIIMTEVLEHMSEKLAKEAIKEARRVCAGQIIITTPGYSRRKPLLAPQSMWVWLRKYGVNETRYIHTAYKVDELRSMCEEAKFWTIESGEITRGNSYYIGAARK